jgi:hypothetical protein
MRRESPYKRIEGLMGLLRMDNADADLGVGRMDT